MNEKNEKVKDRSVAYPSITVSDAIIFTTRLRAALGKGPYSRGEVAKALGHTKLSGPAARKVAALVHYGLLARTGDAYSQTQLAQDIIMPLADEEKALGVVKAVRSPRLFEKLLQKYTGQALPLMLQNVLTREGVSDSAAIEVVRIFTESIKFAGLLVNGVVGNITTAEGEMVSEAVSSTTSSISTPPTITTKNHVRSAETVPSDDFVFNFSGNIRLFVPRSNTTSNAIADGELKAARKEITDFAKKFLNDPLIGQNDSTDVG